MNASVLGIEGEITRLEKITAEAEGAFRRAPKALWSDRTYLAPDDAKALRVVLDHIRKVS